MANMAGKNGVCVWGVGVGVGGELMHWHPAGEAIGRLRQGCECLAAGGIEPVTGVLDRSGIGGRRHGGRSEDERFASALTN
jgi:hypothetical protein